MKLSTIAVFSLGIVAGSIISAAVSSLYHQTHPVELALPLRVTHCLSANYSMREADMVLTIAFDTAGASAYFRRKESWEK